MLARALSLRTATRRQHLRFNCSRTPPAIVLLKMSSSAWRGEYSWEERNYDDANSDESDSGDDDANLTIEQCSEEFMNLLVHLKLTGVLSAYQACILSHWAKRGGLRDPGAKLALAPGQSMGNYSKHFDKATGLSAEMAGEFYRFSMPGILRHTPGRTPLDCSGNLVYKGIQEEVQATPDFFSKATDASRAAAWGLAFSKHEVVRRFGANVTVPLGLDLDGVPFLKRDSALAWWVINLATGRRHLALVLRKRELCRCGCQAGAASMWPGCS